MKKYIKRLFALLLLLVSAFVVSSITTIIEVSAATYYDNITATSGELLKSQLRSLITTTHTYKSSYNDCKDPDIIEKTDGDPNNPGNIILFWSGLSIDSDWDNGATWNREHVWPQSKGWFGTSGAGADLHHIRPTDASVNSSHGNDPYGLVTNGNYVKCSAYNNYYVTNCLKGNSLFEPCDERKGDAARIIFYMLTRYSDSDDTEITNVATSMELLLEWNELDPVDILEENRNNAVASIQGNRNPFIDNSDYAEMIWGDGTSSGESTGGETGGNQGTTNPGVENPSYENGWNLVNNENELAAGDEVIIVAKDYDYAMSTTQNTNNRGQAAVVKSSNDTLIESISDDVLVLTLDKTVSGYYTLFTGDGYLYAADTSGSSNWLRTTTDNSDLDAQWSITVDSTDIATIQAQGDATRNIIRYNLNASNNNPIFSCYQSGQLDVCLYKYNNQEEIVTPENAVDKFANIKTKTSLSFSYNFTNETTFEDIEIYQLVSNISELSADDKIIIVASKDSYALGATQANNYREQAEVIKNENVIESISNNVQVITLGTIGTNYTLYTGSGYLYASGTGKNNYLSTKNDNSDLDAQWSITIDSNGIATIQAQGDAERDIINYNKGSTRFSCYATTSGQQAVCIYKLTKDQVETSESVYCVNSVGIRYGNMISVELYDELLTSGNEVKFGVAALKASTLSAEEKTLKDYIGTKHYYECTPVRVNEYGEADENGDYYQFALVIKGIPMSDIDNDITATCYVSIDGEVTLMNEATNSVRSTAETYLLNDISAEYVDILKYIYNY